MSANGFYIAKGKAPIEDCTDFEALEFAEQVALKDAVQYAREAFKAEIIGGDYEWAHHKFERSANIAREIALHIERLDEYA